MIVLITLTMLIGADSAREVQYTGSLTPANIVPNFDNGYLAVYEVKDAVSVYTPQGSLAFTVPNPAGGHIFNAAVDADGTAAVAVISSGQGSISLVGRTGSLTGSIDTGLFQPNALCFAPDHSIWATGWQRSGEPNDKADYFVLRHFARDGTEIGAYLRRSSFPAASNEPGLGSMGAWGIRIANNRVGALFLHGGHDAVWVETDLKGKELGRWRVDIEGYPAAFTTDGAVYARDTRGVSLLDRSTGKWNVVSSDPGDILLGADGRALVFSVRGANRLRWVPR